MKNILKKRLLILFLLVSGFVLNAQTPPPPPPESPEGGDIGGISTPIDNYLYFLFVVGIIFIFYTLKKQSKLNRI